MTTRLVAEQTCVHGSITAHSFLRADATTHQCDGGIRLDLDPDQEMFAIEGHRNQRIVLTVQDALDNIIEALLSEGWDR